MSIRESTKYAFANALKTLLTTKPLTKIRVTELCEMCGAERPTFYYHFRDKYDLIAWMYLKDLEQSVKDNNGIHNQQQFTRLLHLLREKEAFYKKVFSEQAQNALSNYIIQYNLQNTELLIKKYLGQEVLSKELRFSIQFCVYAWVHSMIQWILNPSDLSAEELAALVYENLPSPMNESFSDEIPYEP